MDSSRLHAMARRYLTDSCTITRRDTVSDGAGGTTASWVTVETGRGCNLQPNPRLGLERMVAAGIENTSRYRLFVDTDTDLRPRDRVTMADGAVLEVVGSETSRTDEPVMDFDLVLIQ